MDQSYRIFTDGSAIGNPGPGGWGVVLIQGKERWEMSGAHPWTTISEMELVAAVQALRSVEGRARIELHSDSEYLIYGMRAFVSRWQRQGWRNRRGTQLQHRELWTELIELDTSLPIRWKWIKGHSGHREQNLDVEMETGTGKTYCYIKTIFELNTSLPIRWKWVKGHSGHRDQSRADKLAYDAARSLRVQQKVAA